MKVMVVFGTRPELIKLAPVILEARRRSEIINLIICSTGQHKEMLNQAKSFFDIVPDEDLALMKDNQTLADLTCRLMTGMDEVIRNHKPDVVIVQGDTTTAFVSALASFYHRIPVAHVEAGLRTGDLNSPFPEEGNRTLIAQLARWHFAPTAEAASQLFAEGVKKQNVHITGNTVVDAIEIIKRKWTKNPYVGAVAKLFPGQQLVFITTHRRENFGEGIRNICQAVRQLSRMYPQYGFVFPVHLNPNVSNVVYQQLADIKNLHLMPPIDFEASLYLQSKACLILTDSGGIQEESTSFGVPCIVLRQHTERKEGILAGFALLAGTNYAKIVQIAVDFLSVNMIQILKNKANPYGDGQSSIRILDQLLLDSGFTTQQQNG